MQSYFTFVSIWIEMTDVLRRIAIRVCSSCNDLRRYSQNCYRFEERL